MVSFEERDAQPVILRLKETPKASIFADVGATYSLLSATKPYTIRYDDLVGGMMVI